MAKQEVPLQTLSDFLPPNTADQVLGYLKKYRVHLTITQPRRSVLGDYRHRYEHKPHRISVNGSLNPYAFLITLLHELAHLLTFEQHGNRVAAHGTEWKACFAALLKYFVQSDCFPEDLKRELYRTIKNPAASSCAEEGLIRTLRRYDQSSSTEGRVLVEELSVSDAFSTPEGRQFKVEKRLRKRYLCTEIRTGKQYLFSPVYEVIPLS